MLLHGFMGSGQDWAPIAAELSDFWVVAPDLPGHGASVGLPKTAYSLTGAAQWVRQHLPHGRPAVIGGYSMGGRVALHLEGLPEGSQICLVGAHPGITAPDERRDRLERDRRLAERLEADFQGFLADWMNLPLFATLTSEQRQEIVERRLRSADPAELARALRGLSTGHQEDCWPTADEGLTFVVGSDDQRYLNLYEQTQVPFKIVPGAGHNVIAQAPSKLAAILRELAARPSVG